VVTASVGEGPAVGLYGRPDAQGLGSSVDRNWGISAIAVKAIYDYFGDPHEFEKFAPSIWVLEAASVGYEGTRRGPGRRRRVQAQTAE